MNTNTSLLATDKFSIHRAMMVARYYWPSLYTVFLMVAGGMLMTIILLMLSHISFAFSMVAGAVSCVTGFIMYLSPLCLCRSRKPSIETLLPATAGEKSAVLVVFFLILLPLLTMIPSIFCSKEMIRTLMQSNMELQLLDDVYQHKYMLGSFNSMGPTAMCLYAVTAWPGRKSKAVLMTLGVLLLLFVVGGTLGGWFAFKLGYEDAINGRNMANVEELTMEFGNMLAESMFYVSIGMMVLTAVLVWLTYKKMLNRQF